MSHKYAIKRKGKTLGIKDDEQLTGLVKRGKIKPEDRVYVLEEKQWVSAEDIPATQGLFQDLQDVSTSTISLPVMNLSIDSGSYDDMQAPPESESDSNLDLGPKATQSGIHRIEQTEERNFRRTMIVTAVKDQKAVKKVQTTNQRYYKFGAALLVVVVLALTGIFILREHANQLTNEQFSQVQTVDIENEQDIMIKDN